VANPVMVVSIHRSDERLSPHKAYTITNPAILGGAVPTAVDHRNLHPVAF
jgi:hypothetical protein